MKKIITTVLLGLACYNVNAQLAPGFSENNKKVICGPVDAIFKILSGPDFNERPAWIAVDDSGQSKYVLFVNFNTRMFTIVQFTETTACILGAGAESTFHLPTRTQMNK